MHRRKEKPNWTELVSSAIEDEEIFDIIGTGYRSIHTAIAQYLIDRSPMVADDKMYHATEIAKKVKGAFWRAVDVLTSQGIKIYLMNVTKAGVPGNGRIRVVTTRSYYKDSEEADYERIKRGLCRNVKPRLRQIHNKHVDKLDEIQGFFPTLLPQPKPSDGDGDSSDNDE